MVGVADMQVQRLALVAIVANAFSLIFLDKLSLRFQKRKEKLSLFMGLPLPSSSFFRQCSVPLARLRALAFV